MSNEEVLQILLELRDILREINRKLDKISVGGKEDGKRTIVNGIDPLTLLELPDNLRNSYMVLLQLKEATAEDVASVTGRGRAIESHYLNTLVNMGYLDKKRVGKKVYFSLK